ncbi:MAG: hypothetical protein IJW45_02960 [Oscillospiraceae bacterium]|nr:hypothetical protein [Oscillospiraceae bacterium]
MKRRIKLFFMLVIVVFLCILSSCYALSDTARMISYYSEPSNYVAATGTVIHIAYAEDFESLYLGISDTSYRFDDVNFVIEGKNLEIVREAGIDDVLKIGDTVTFSVAPKYWGDGYCIPLVAISTGDDVFLRIEEGVPNLLEWLRS